MCGDPLPTTGDPNKDPSSGDIREHWRMLRRITIGCVAEFVPPDFEVPLGLETSDFVLEPLGPPRTAPRKTTTMHARKTTEMRP